MQELAESTGNFKLREIMNELSTLFTDAIEQVRVMVRSTALKAPISNRLIPSVQMT